MNAQSTPRILLALSLAVMLPVAGCTGIYLDQPTKQERPVTFVANNTLDTPHTFEVFVVDVPANITTRRNDGLSGSNRISRGSGTIDPGDGYYYTEVDPESGRHHDNFTVGGNESTRSRIENPPVGFAVIVVVYDEQGRIISWAQGRCDDLALTYLKVTSRSHGVSITHSCR